MISRLFSLVGDHLDRNKYLLQGFFYKKDIASMCGGNLILFNEIRSLLLKDRLWYDLDWSSIHLHVGKS